MIEASKLLWQITPDCRVRSPAMYPDYVSGLVDDSLTLLEFRVAASLIRCDELPSHYVRLSVVV